MRIGLKMPTGRWTMKCPDCGGKMTLEYHGAREDNTAEDAYWKCIDCHKLLDYGYFQGE